MNHEDKKFPINLHILGNFTLSEESYKSFTGELPPGNYAIQTDNTRSNRQYISMIKTWTIKDLLNIKTEFPGMITKIIHIPY